MNGIGAMRVPQLLFSNVMSLRGPLRGRPKHKAPESAPPAGPIAQLKNSQQTEEDIDSCKVHVLVRAEPLRATREYIKTAK